MNIHNALLKEHSRAQAEKIARYIGDDAALFSELMHEFSTAEYRINQRAAYVLSKCIDNHPALIKPWWRKMLDKLKNGNTPPHDAVIRNTLRICEQVELPVKYHAEIYNRCIGYINDVHNAIAIRAFALTVAARLAKIYPDLANEVTPLAESFLLHDSPALKVRGRDALKMLRG